ncbi:hypothetical protein [Novosphingobium aquae]|uniref:Uncharacterized protein n=1 Tax=Novosphingobium aquae TaxID=3133435 RepID=A0ABU8S860_9SPHN
MAMMHARGGAAALPPLALFSQALPRLTRHELEGVVEMLMDRLDTVAGDPDIEPNGDELDGSDAEDDTYHHNWPIHLHGPGCPISDPHAACDDKPIDAEEEGHLEDDRALSCPTPIHGPDQRLVMHRLPTSEEVPTYQHE